VNEPVTPDPDPDARADAEDATMLPVEIDLETPEADLLDQSIPVVLDVEGYPNG